MPRAKDLTGKRFGYVIILQKAYRENKVTYWKCLCDCGMICILRGQRFTGRKSKNANCGCKASQILSDSHKLPENRGLINKLFNAYKRTAKLRNLNFSLSIDEFIYLIHGECFYCGEASSNSFKLKNYTIVYNGIDRKDNSLGYSKENCVSACKFCNFAKGTLTVDEFLRKINKIIVHFGLS